MKHDEDDAGQEIAPHVPGFGTLDLGDGVMFQDLSPELFSSIEGRALVAPELGAAITWREGAEGFASSWGLRVSASGGPDGPVSFWAPARLRTQILIGAGLPYALGAIAGKDYTAEQATLDAWIKAAEASPGLWCFVWVGKVKSSRADRADSWEVKFGRATGTAAADPEATEHKLRLTLMAERERRIERAARLLGVDAPVRKRME